VNASKRHARILDWLAERGSASVADLSRRLGVSAVTVRADLRGLAEEGLVARARGGVSAALRQNVRRKLNSRVDEKKRIAKAAAGLIRDGDRVMILAGTTCAGIVQHLYGKRDVQIVTNSTLILQQARSNPAVTVILVGGQYAPFSEALVGPIALKALEPFHVEKAFVGTDGFTVESGITAELSELAEVASQMIAQADRAIVLADASKYGRTGFARIAPLGAVHQLITDAGLPAAARAKLEKLGIVVTLV